MYRYVALANSADPDEMPPYFEHPKQMFRYEWIRVCQQFTPQKSVYFEVCVRIEKWRKRLLDYFLPIYMQIVSSLKSPKPLMSHNDH